MPLPQKRVWLFDLISPELWDFWGWTGLSSWFPIPSRHSPSLVEHGWTLTRLWRDYGNPRTGVICFGNSTRKHCNSPVGLRFSKKDQSNDVMTLRLCNEHNLQTFLSQATQFHFIFPESIGSLGWKIQFQGFGQLRRWSELHAGVPKSF